MDAWKRTRVWPVSLTCCFVLISGGAALNLVSACCCRTPARPLPALHPDGGNASMRLAVPLLCAEDTPLAADWLEGLLSA